MEKLAVVVNNRVVGYVNTRFQKGIQGILTPRLIGINIIMTGAETECYPIFSPPIIIGRARTEQGGDDLAIQFNRVFDPSILVRFRLRPPFICVEKIKEETFNIVRWERDDSK